MDLFNVKPLTLKLKHWKKKPPTTTTLDPQIVKPALELDIVARDQFRFEIENNWEWEGDLNLGSNGGCRRIIW